MTTGAPESGKLQVFKGNRISLVRPLFLYEFLSISIFTLAGGCGLGLPRFHDVATASPGQTHGGLDLGWRQKII